MLKKLLIFIIVKTRRNSHVSHKNSKKRFLVLHWNLDIKHAYYIQGPIQHYKNVIIFAFSYVPREYGS